MLDPQAQALLDLIRQRNIPSTHELSPTEARRAYRERRTFSQPAPQDVARQAPGATDARPGGAV